MILLHNERTLTINTGNVGEGFILKTDKSGNKIWEIEVPFINVELNWLQELPTGNLLITGRDYTDRHFPTGIIIEISKDGEILRHKKVEESYPRFLEDGTEYIFKDSFLIHQTVWEHENWKYNIGHHKDSLRVNYLIEKDGGIVVSGINYGHKADTGFVKSIPVGFKLNKDGKLSWVEEKIGASSIYNLPTDGYMNFWTRSSRNGEDNVNWFIDVNRDTIFDRFMYPTLVGYSIFKPQTYCPPSNILPDSMVFCPDFSTTLIANEWEKDWLEKQEVIFDWSTGENTPEIEITSPGTYQVTVTMNGKCAIEDEVCLLYTSPSPRDATLSRMPSSA